MGTHSTSITLRLKYCDKEIVRLSVERRSTAPRGKKDDVALNHIIAFDWTATRRSQ